jgi:RNA polymerase sigma factor (sigma-70 family)
VTPGAEEAPEALVRRAQAGDPRAVACLVERHHDALTRFCRHLVGEAGPDLAQETLLRAVPALGRLREPARFPAWLLGIAANLARKWWRRRARWPLSLEGLAEAYPDVPWPAAPLWSPAAGEPEAAAVRAEEARRLGAAVGALPAPLRRVLVLHYLDGLSYAEIAAALDVPVSTVKGRLFKSRARLRGALDPDGTAAPRPHRRKETATMTAIPTPQEPADARLVPVEVESIRVGGDPPTAENVRPYLEKLLTQQPPDEERPYLAPVVERLRALVAETGLLVRRPSCVVVLKETDGERFLTIVVGVAEAEALALHLQGHSVPRPLSHDLMRTLVEASGLRLERAAVTAWEREKQLFYATLTLRRPRGRAVEVDARPSDAINLALRAGAPLFAAEAVLAQAGITARNRDACPPPVERPAADR